MNRPEGGNNVLTGISSMATRQLLAELADAWQQKTGASVAIESVGGVAATTRVLEGESFDVVVLASDAIDKLAAAARIDPSSRVDIVRSDIAIAVREGSPLPDIRDEEAVRDAVGRASAVGYSSGPSGTHVRRVLERWGMTGGTSTKVVQAPPGVPVATLLARNEVDIGFQQFSELMNVDGITIVGPMPPAIQATTVFAGAAGVTTARRDDAQAFLAWLASAEVEDVKRRHGMTSA